MEPSTLKLRVTSRHWIVASMILAQQAVTNPIRAQTDVVIGAQTTFSHAYVWRGVTFVDNAVVQPAVTVGVGSFNLGAWANAETTAPDGIDHFGMLGAGESGLGEWDLWAEYAHSFATQTVGIDVSVGGIHYRFPNPAGSDSHTTEFYTGVALDLPAVPIKPALAVFYDVDAVDGAYVEGSLAYSSFISPFATLEFASLTGYSVSQNGNFGENGLTHADFSSGVALAAGPVSIVPTLHFQLCNAAATRVRSLTALDSGTKVWFGVAVGWEQTLPIGR